LDGALWGGGEARITAEADAPNRQAPKGRTNDNRVAKKLLENVDLRKLTKTAKDRPAAVAELPDLLKAMEAGRV
jgi:hypothetical protein